MRNIIFSEKYTVYVIFSFIFSPPLYAQEQDLLFGLRAGVSLGDGVPANDMPAIGIYGKYRFNPDWTLGFALDRFTYDFETPHNLLSLQQDSSSKALDAGARTTKLSGWLEYHFIKSGNLDWFWSAGVGLAETTIDDLTGPLQGGGSFNIKTDADTETLLFTNLGIEMKFSERWFFDVTGGVERHLTDWKVTDSVSGKSTTVDDYSTWNIQAGITHSF